MRTNRAIGFMRGANIPRAASVVGRAARRATHGDVARTTRDGGDARGGARRPTATTSTRDDAREAMDAAHSTRRRSRRATRGATSRRARAAMCAVTLATLARARSGRATGEGAGGDGTTRDATPNARDDAGDAPGYVDASAGTRFGTMDDALMRRIVEDEAPDDPDEMYGADEDEDEEAYEDEEEDEDDAGGSTARLGARAPTKRQMMKIRRARMRRERDEAALGALEDPDEALRRARDALAGAGDGATGGEEDAPSAARTMPTRPPANAAAIKERAAARRRAGATPRRGFPQSVPGSTKGASSKDARQPGWELTFSDEFDGDALDLSKWRPKVNESAPGLERHGGQQQFYVPEMCKVVDGALVIGTRRQRGVRTAATPHGGAVGHRGRGDQYPFLSCWVDTKEAFTQTYGRVEIRAKIPESKCPGVWPQHWMLPDPEKSVPKRACWPLGGQIDIMQSYGRGLGGPGTRAGTVESGYHFAPKAECGAEGFSRSAYPPMMDPAIDFSADFHTYAVEWSKDSLTFTVDGHPVHHLTRFNVPIIPRWPFYLILNTAVSPFGMPAALNQCDDDMFHYVDYVRVYKRASAQVNADVWRFLSFSVVVLITFVAASVCTLRRAFNRDVDDYGIIDGDDEDEDVDLLAFDEDLYITHADEFGTATHKPVKAFSYSVNDDDDSTISFNRRRTDRTEAETPLIGDVALALPDDGTGRFRSSGPYIRRRANPPKSSRPGVYSDVWARDE